MVAPRASEAMLSTLAWPMAYLPAATPALMPVAQGRAVIHERSDSSDNPNLTAKRPMAGFSWA
jgi:hypothetical protein